MLRLTMSQTARTAPRITSYNVCYTKLLRIPAGLFAQAGDSDASGAVDEEQASPEGFTVSIEAGTGFNLLSFVPGIPFIIGVP